jgi:YebC/PmpR family DNA-binding regulatory protein
MPKDNIEAAIKRANGKDAANYSEVNYEGKGPHGVLIFIECTTDNSTRTVANIKSLFTKASGALVPTGSLEFMFSRKAVFEVKKTPELDMDELELGLIEAGLESTESDEDTLYIYGDYTNFGSLSSAIADMGLEITKAGLERIANDPKDFTDEQAADIQKLIDKIEDDDDVQAVYTNIA